jgi:hypothetical protein
MVTDRRVLVLRTAKRQITDECPPRDVLWIAARAELRPAGPPPLRA